MVGLPLLDDLLVLFTRCEFSELGGFDVGNVGTRAFPFEFVEFEVEMCVGSGSVVELGGMGFALMHDCSLPFGANGLWLRSCGLGW